MVHAKTATVDGRWSTVGTANIDRLSMTGNYEVNVEFIDPDLAAEMERIYACDLTNAVELTAAEWAARGLHKRFTELRAAPVPPAALTTVARPSPSEHPAQQPVAVDELVLEHQPEVQHECHVEGHVGRDVDREQVVVDE